LKLNIMNKPIKIMDQDTGFTLIEMMITLAITSIVMMFLYSVHNNLTISTANQKLKIQMQQNLRGGFSVMEKEIRMAGYDPEGTGHFTIMDVGYRLKNKTSSVNINSSVNQGYSSSLVFAYDRDHDGFVGSNEVIAYSVCDLLVSKPDGIPDLARNAGGGRQKVAVGIEKIGFAYAIDSDLDGVIDFTDSNSDGVMNPGDHFVWAVDTDGDRMLDLNIDINRDGRISLEDDSDGNGVINQLDATFAPIPDVELNKIRAVRIWLLARSGKMIRNRSSGSTYVVGNMIVSSHGDSFARRMLTSIVWCRNMRI